MIWETFKVLVGLMTAGCLIIALATGNMWWLLGAGGCLFFTLLAHPDDW